LNYLISGRQQCFRDDESQRLHAGCRDATIPYDVRLFESLNRFVQAEPWLTRDKVIIDSLKAVGIAKGKPFSPDAKTRSIIDEAARVAGASIHIGRRLH
jgi:hypothetical protein